MQVAGLICLEGLVLGSRGCRLQIPQIAHPMTAQAAVEATGAAAVLAAVAEGELTPAEGASIMALVEAYRRTLETCELEARVVALEAGAA